MTICRLTKDADACRVLWLSEWSVRLLFPRYKDNLTLWPDDFVLLSFSKELHSLHEKYFDFIKYFMI